MFELSRLSEPRNAVERASCWCPRGVVGRRAGGPFGFDAVALATLTSVPADGGRGLPGGSQDRVRLLELVPLAALREHRSRESNPCVGALAGGDGSLAGRLDGPVGRARQRHRAQRRYFFEPLLAPGGGRCEDIGARRALRGGFVAGARQLAQEAVLGSTPSAALEEARATDTGSRRRSAARAPRAAPAPGARARRPLRRGALHRADGAHRDRSSCSSCSRGVERRAGRDRHRGLAARRRASSSSR